MELCASAQAQTEGADMRTLFYTASSRAAVLVTDRGGRHRSRRMRFADAHAALDWCAAHRCNMVYFAAVDPARN